MGSGQSVTKKGHHQKSQGTNAVTSAQTGSRTNPESSRGGKTVVGLSLYIPSESSASPPQQQAEQAVVMADSVGHIFVVMGASVRRKGLRVAFL